jgi:hypothetical protein
MTLKTDMANDLANVFFNTDEFAVAAVYTPITGTAKTINVIFDREYVDTPMGMAASRISCLCKTSDTIGMVPRETLVIEGTTYKIKGPLHPTADGTTEIELSID